MRTPCRPLYVNHFILIYHSSRSEPTLMQVCLDAIVEEIKLIVEVKMNAAALQGNLGEICRERLHPTPSLTLLPRPKKGKEFAA